jgi:hypothetical protein
MPGAAMQATICDRVRRKNITRCYMSQKKAQSPIAN